MELILRKFRFYKLLFVGLLFSCQEELYFEEAYCLKNVNVVDPLEGLMDGMTVVVKGNKIFKIGKKISNKILLFTFITFQRTFNVSSRVNKTKTGWK